MELSPQTNSKRSFGAWTTTEPGKLWLLQNIAAASITIEGIRYVIDSGLVKQKQFNQRTGVESLVTVPISKFEAIQRAGRAGRTCDGYCIRLYDKEIFELFNEESTPEIQRTELSSVVLNLKCAGIDDAESFSYVDRPETWRLKDAEKQVRVLGAADKSGRVTPLGRQLGRLPLSLPLGLSLLEATKVGCVQEILTIIAMLSVENIFLPKAYSLRSHAKSDLNSRIRSELDYLQSRSHLNHLSGGNDFILMLVVYNQWDNASSGQEWCQTHHVNNRSMETVRKIRLHLAELLQHICPHSHEHTERNQESGSTSRLDSSLDPNLPIDSPIPPHISQAIMRCLCAGMFRSVARRDTTKQHLFRTMDGHGTVAHIQPSSALFYAQPYLLWPERFPQHVPDSEPQPSAEASSMSKHHIKLDKDLPSWVDWVLYMDIVQTSTKTQLSTVAPIRYDWVSDLLPRLHQSGDSAPSEKDEAEQSAQTKTAKITTPTEANSTINSEEDIAAARERYLERKKARQEMAAAKAAKPSSSAHKKRA